MKDEEHFLSNEYCYNDGKWNRCKDFPTVTLSVYHPVLRKQVPLFIMECEGETVECYTKFFSPLSTKQLKKSFQAEFLIQLLGSWPMKLVEFRKGQEKSMEIQSLIS